MCLICKFCCENNPASCSIPCIHTVGSLSGIYRLHQAVGTSLLHVAPAELWGYSHCAVGPTRALERRSGRGCLPGPAGSGRGWKAGADVALWVPHGLGAAVLVHQHEGRVEQLAAAGLVAVGPRGRGGGRHRAVRTHVVAVAGRLRGWAEETLHSEMR